MLLPNLHRNQYNKNTLKYFSISALIAANRLASACAAQARSGVEQNYQLELGANKTVYASQVDAAGQIRSAGLEAAKLRQAAAVIAAVGREISREVGQGMRIRF
jgi:hypothetical protein